MAFKLYQSSFYVWKRRTKQYCKTTETTGWNWWHGYPIFPTNIRRTLNFSRVGKISINQHIFYPKWQIYDLILMDFCNAISEQKATQALLDVCSSSTDVGGIGEPSGVSDPCGEAWHSSGEGFVVFWLSPLPTFFCLFINDIHQRSVYNFSPHKSEPSNLYIIFLNL